MGDPQSGTPGYWYPECGRRPGPVDVLNLLRGYREAERRMRARTRESMGMGESDLAALRFILRATHAGRIVRQRDVAEALEITSASASTLVDRLCRDGHVRRVPHPQDRRSVGIEPTAHGDEEVRQTLGEMHRKMLDAADSLTPEELAGAAKFLAVLTESVK